MPLDLAFCPFVYHPYGGLERDFLRIARACERRGHRIHVLTTHWQGSPPAGWRVALLRPGRLRSHNRVAAFARQVGERVAQHRYHAVVGFNRMPGLDLYYAADPCYAATVRRLRSPLYRLTSRYRGFAALERMVFEPASRTQILLIAESEQSRFTGQYGTPAERFHLLPPGIDATRRAPPDAARLRSAFRREHGLGQDDRLVLMVGSDFARKGVDRLIRAFALLTHALRARTRVMVVGNDREGSYKRLARRLSLSDRVHFLGGRDDVPRFLLGADLLAHPARSENTGTVLLEALCAGLPVLASDVCGYATHIQRADAGRLIPYPFDDALLAQTMEQMLADRDRLRAWSGNAVRYADTEDLYSMPEAAAELIERYAEDRP